MHRKWMVIACALSLIVGLAGCGEEEVTTGKPTAADFEKDREAMANRATKKKSGKAGKAARRSKKKGGKVVPETSGYAVAEQDYFYDPRGKRDPFRSFRFANDEDAENKKVSGPLGDFELGQLELSAVIWDAGNPRALIMDPGGRSFIVREGSQIGKNSGQVIHIGDSLVLVKETYENFAGEQTTKDVELRISLNQGG